MIFLDRRRLFIWLIKAYFKRWKTTILFSFIFGLVFFFALYIFARTFQPTLPQNKEIIGMVGSYNQENLPSEILNRISYGLTSISSNGKPFAAAANSWEIKDNGKTYIFNLKNNLIFTDGSKLTSNQINYNFEDVVVEKPSDYKIIFKLKNSYSPFLVTTSKPIFKKRFIGLENYKLKSLNLNGEFVNFIELRSTISEKSIAYQFYPTENALKTAFILGEISKTSDISDLSILNMDLSHFDNYKIDKRINYEKLVSLFYNTQDKFLSDKRLREALSYALPNTFTQGQRNRTPYPPTLWANQENTSYEKDFPHAKLLLSETQSSGSAKTNLRIKTLPKYKLIAEEIKNSWKEIGIKSNIEIVNSLPLDFQIFLGEFNVSKDPDQYSLWHSSQTNNITNYKNLRIDKLLEDGRQITNLTERQKIYADFQKYLLDDPPASFLYFPYFYTISKN